jgi:hypothetical protein
MNRTLALAPILGLAALVLTGCADRGTPLQPVGTPVLILDYRAERRSTAEGEAIDFTARIFNRGRTTVTYTGGGCGLGSYWIKIVDPERRNRLDLCGCPGVACPLCAPGIIPLEPGRWLTIRKTFTGTLVDCDGPFQGPTGHYFATATFDGQGADGTSNTLTRSIPFDWTAPSP